MSKLRLLIPIALLTALFGVLMSSCNDDNEVWDKYKDWRIANEEFFNEQRYMTENGSNVYQTLSPSWNSSATVLIRYLNDRKKTEGNLSPMLTSTVAVKYIGRLYNGVPFDSSYLQPSTVYGDSLFLTTPGQVIQGWTIALLNMRVGDSARVVIPYNLAYGSSGSGIISPYSTLVFDMKLVDIPFYEVRP